MRRTNFVMKKMVLFCLISSCIINIMSYFIYSEYIFWFCIFLIIPLFIFGLIFTLNQKKNWRKWKSTEKEVIFFLILICLLTMVYLFYTLDNNIFEKNSSGYILKHRATYIRDATKLEYGLYMSRLSRLFSSMFLVFFYSFLVLSKNE